MTTHLITRGGFGWAPFTGHGANTNLGLVVHYDGSAQHLEGLPHGECHEYWVRTRRMHMDERKWADIGYSYGACPHGFVFEGRGYGKEQAAQRTDPGGIPNGNARYCSVTLMSGPKETIPERQLEAVRWLRTMLMHEHGMSGDVFGHKDFSNTDCPGGIAYELVRKHAFTGPPMTVRPTLKLVTPYMRGDAVREAQRLLGVVPVDGIYGPQTAAEVKEFKKLFHLPSDTTLGPNAWKVLLGM